MNGLVFAILALGFLCTIAAGAYVFDKHPERPKPWTRLPLARAIVPTTIAMNLIGLIGQWFYESRFVALLIPLWLLCFCVGIFAAYMKRLSPNAA